MKLSVCKCCSEEKCYVDESLPDDEYITKVRELFLEFVKEKEIPFNESEID